MRCNLLAWMLAMVMAPAYAAQPQKDPAASTAPCAVIKTFQGEVQVLDPTRTEVLETRPSSGVPCGGWVSVRGGQLELNHRQGFQIRTSHDTYFEIYDNTQDQSMTGENHIVLFRGKLLITKPPGSLGEVRVLTPNGRVTIENGSSVVMYQSSEEETQLISLEHAATLENRFEPNQRVVAHAGETTQLNFKLLRLTPSVARPVDVGSLKLSLLDIALSPQELKSAMIQATQRQMPRQTPQQGSRSLAQLNPGSRSKNSKSHHSYGAHLKTRGDAKAGREWKRRLAGGVSNPDDFLRPQETRFAQRKRSKIWVEDLDEAHGNVPGDQRLENKRVLDELSRIQARD